MTDAEIIAGLRRLRAPSMHEMDVCCAAAERLERLRAMPVHGGKYYDNGTVAAFVTWPYASVQIGGTLGDALDAADAARKGEGK